MCKNKGQIERAPSFGNFSSLSLIFGRLVIALGYLKKTALKSEITFPFLGGTGKGSMSLDFPLHFCFDLSVHWFIENESFPFSLRGSYSTSQKVC